MELLGRDELEKHPVLGLRPAGFGTARYLYHYTPWQTLLGVMRDSALRLGKLGSTNDPRESSEWLFPIATDPRVSVPREKVDELIREVKLYKSCVRVVGFSQDQDPPLSSAGSYVGAGFARPSMWAHYAANHSGCCIIFDRERLVERVRGEIGDGEKTWVRDGPVQYAATESDDLFQPVAARQMQGRNTRDVVEKHFSVHSELWFQKHPDWRPEAEFRIVVYRGDPEDVVQVDLSRCVVGLVLGAAFPEMCLSVVESFHKAFSLGGSVVGSAWEGPYWRPRVLVEESGRLALEASPVGTRFLVAFGALLTAEASLTVGAHAPRA